MDQLFVSFERQCLWYKLYTINTNKRTRDGTSFWETFESVFTHPRFQLKSSLKVWKIICGGTRGRQPLTHCSPPLKSGGSGCYRFRVIRLKMAGLANPDRRKNQTNRITLCWWLYLVGGIPNLPFTRKGKTKRPITFLECGWIMTDEIRGLWVVRILTKLFFLSFNFSILVLI